MSNITQGSAIVVLGRGLTVLALCLLASFPALAQDTHLPMTAEEIVQLARPAVGHGYHWDHGNWTRDGSEIGKCSPNVPGGGCGACTFDGDYGSDCSGFVAKVWQVPVPTPVEHDTHPYSTGAFASPNNKPWSKVQVATDSVRRGDALVKGGSHIVLVDQKLANGDYIVYHASGCAKGIVHERKTAANMSGFTPIRRDDVTDATTRDCGGQGTFGDDKTCHCNGNTAGENCGSCLPGYVRYPQCVSESCGATRSGTNRLLQGRLNCGSKYTFKLAGGGNGQTEYGCGPKPLNAEEVGFQFRPPGVGTAKLSIASAADASMMLMRGDCSPDSCIMSSTDSLELSFGGDDEFYVVVDAPSATNEDVTIEVTCEVPRSAFIGDACSEDSDCPDALTSRWGTAMDGFCYHGEAGSFCSVVCTGSCPDLINAAPTACAKDPAEESNRGICLPISDDANLQCGTVPGTRAEERSRHGAGGKREFCFPVANPEACVADFKGMVVDDSTGAAIAGASVSYTNSAGTQTATTNALGQFVSGDLPCGSHEFLIQADNYSPKTVGGEVQARGKDIGQVRLLSHGAQCIPATAQIQGQVKDGVNDVPVAGATVELREGAGVSAGMPLQTAQSDADGRFSFGGLVAGDFTVSATADGFTPGARETLTLCESAMEEEDIYLTPTIATAHSYRFVLTWSDPDDLDIHLLTPTGEDVFYWESCRGSTTAPPFARLDVDHYQDDGPETITLADLAPGRYELFVHNFAADNWREPEFEEIYTEAPTSLAASGAELTVYDGEGQVVDRFNVPSSGSGVFWDVLAIELEGGVPKITQLQRLHNSRKNPWDEYAGDCNPE